MSNRCIHLDLHPVAHDGKAINNALIEVFKEAKRKKAVSIEIITGKGSGQLKKKVERFIRSSSYVEEKCRIKKDFNNHGRLFVYFSR